MRIIRSPMFVCSFLLIAGMVLMFTVFWRDTLVYNVPLMNWATVVASLYSLLIAVIYVYWIRYLEESKSSKAKINKKDIHSA